MTQQNISFLELLESTYSQCKQLYEANPEIFQSVPLATEVMEKGKRDKDKEDRTRSKSRKKIGDARRSMRKSRKLRGHGHANEDGDEGQLMEIDREPLWHPNKIRENRSREKISLRPKLEAVRIPKPIREREIQVQPRQKIKKKQREKIAQDPEMEIKTQRKKIKSTDPLYEFYSESVEDNGNRENEQREEKPEVYPEPERDPQPEPEEDPYPQPQSQLQLQPQPSLQPQPQPQPQPQQMPEPQPVPFTPTKHQSSLLSIQTLLDNYFLFKSQMRSSSLTNFTELTRYIRQINGYNFNYEVFHQLLELNPGLYQLRAIGSNRYVRCSGLSQREIGRRLGRTKMAMVRGMKDRNDE